MRNELSHVQKSIEKTEGEIEKVEQKIEEVMTEKERDILRDKEKQLRDEKNKLHDEKNRLHDEKNKLRDEKMFLMEEQRRLRESSSSVRSCESRDAIVEEVAGRMDRLSVKEMPFYEVCASIAGSRKKRGIRAAIYMRAEFFHGLYYPGETSTICYEGNDLKIRVLFETKDNAYSFRTFLSQWSYTQPLLSLGDSVVVEEEIRVVMLESSPRCILLAHYDGLSSDSPMLSLSDFRGSVASTEQEGLDRWDPLVQFQSIENPRLFLLCKAYRMHIKDKSQFSSLKDNVNNLFAGTWTPFHQLFDGLMVYGGVPLMAIQCVGREGEKELVGEPAELRERVELEIEFFSELAAGTMAPQLKDGSERVGELKWKSFVHVLDGTLFRECVQWKYEDTKANWA